jgi:hypothetical protein
LPPGLGKRIEWSAKDELKEFVGDVTFEVRAELVATFFVDSPAIGSKVKKGKTLNITWKGGSPGESMRLDLMKGGAVIAQIASVQNNQRFAWVVPKTMDKGSDYQVRLTGDSGSAMSGNFGIKSKTPFMLKILPVVAVGGIAYLVLGGKEKKESDLPKPPEPN